MLNLKLSILENQFSICRLSANAQIPQWVNTNNFYSITKTQDELSIVCLNENIPTDIKSEKGWRIMKVEGTLDFSLTGILSSITEPLAKAQISLFAISTFDTDYILIKNDKIDQARVVLIQAGFHF